MLYGALECTHASSLNPDREARNLVPGPIRAFSCRLPGQGAILNPKVGIMSTMAAAELARLRTRFRDWDIIRTRCGIFIAGHRITGEHITAPTLAHLENRLLEWVCV
jgi:hypothetical protein